MAAWASTGIQGLDQILCDLKKGDNIVWQVDRIEDYRHFVTPYIEKALADQRNIVYLRFAQHPPLIEEQPGVTLYQLDARTGFESFSTQVHSIISQEGLETYYLFDCLSDLLSAWATDLMIGNFFMITCPYLFELDTITYFALLRNSHSFQTVARIRETTQLLLDVHHLSGIYYVHPLKVWNRYSPTMFLPHAQHGQDFDPLISSVDASELFSHISQAAPNGSARALAYWDRLFAQADTLVSAPPDSAEVQDLIREICATMVGRERRIAQLAQDFFSLHDLISIKKRLIGSGFIGGKAAGMLLAQKILLLDESFDSSRYTEPHDSFYIGSDVFYSYIVENGWWKLLMQQKAPGGYFEVAPQIKANLLRGKFPDQTRQQFQEIIEYFGQSPIIVRSSSLLEDSFGNAFAGKYESLFLANQGDPQQRYAQFEEAVRRVYASTMGADALAYRRQRGLDEQDEQMALLVQRVSGSYKKHYFFPDLAGVGVSYNTFVWQSDLDPQAGMIRLVFGLGTRAVDRVEDDYPQTIALDRPLLRPYADREDECRFSQHHVDLLDTSENCLTTVPAVDLLTDEFQVNVDLLATLDRQAERRMKELKLTGKRPWRLTFKKLLSDTDFIQILQKMLKTLEAHYHYPVDIEFTVNFTNDQAFRINLVQCRPLQVKGLGLGVEMPEHTPPEKTLFASHSHTMGGSIVQPIKKIIYVDPRAYVETPLTEKPSIARLVGKLNVLVADRETAPTLLMGPGRWGTTTPSLGVPVSFSEINNIAVLAEIAYEGGNLMPDLSFGTHFFQDLVESEVFYVALFPQKEDVFFNREMLNAMPNLLTDLIPEAQPYEHVVKVYDTSSDQLQLVSDIMSQKVLCSTT